jgi:hypothetical protein
MQRNGTLRKRQPNGDEEVVPVRPVAPMSEADIEAAAASDPGNASGLVRLLTGVLPQHLLQIPTIHGGGHNLDVRVVLQAEDVTVDDRKMIFQEGHASRVGHGVPLPEE